MRFLIAVFGLFFVYNSYSSVSEILTVKDKIIFPDFGPVLANKVCVTADKETLKTTIPESYKKKCVDSQLDESDVNNPRKVCTKIVFEKVPPINLSLPVNSTVKKCIRWSVENIDYNDPYKSCLEFKDVQVSRSLIYMVIHYKFDDYKYENPYYSYADLKTCE